MTKIWRLIARFQYAGAGLSGPTALDLELSAAVSLCAIYCVFCELAQSPPV